MPPVFLQPVERADQHRIGRIEEPMREDHRKVPLHGDLLADGLFRRHDDQAGGRAGREVAAAPSDRLVEEAGMGARGIIQATGQSRC